MLCPWEENKLHTSWTHQTCTREPFSTDFSDMLQESKLYRKILDWISLKSYRTRCFKKINSIRISTERNEEMEMALWKEIVVSTLEKTLSLYTSFSNNIFMKLLVNCFQLLKIFDSTSFTALCQSFNL